MPLCAPKRPSARPTKNRLWEAGVGSLRKNMAEVNARLIALSKQGEAIANYIGAEETLPLPNAPETAGLCPAVENNAAAPQGGGPEEDISRLGGLLFEQSAAAEQIGRAYDALSFLGSQKRMLEKTTPMRNPVLGKNWLASRFGYRKDPFTGRRAFHAGTDYAARRGTPVAAAASGIVIYVGRLGNYGNAVHLYHGDDVSSLYGHLKEAHVELFQYVSQGEQIGEVGSTGRSTGPHLHYEVRIKNRSRPLTKTLRNLRQRRGLS